MSPSRSSTGGGYAAFHESSGGRLRPVARRRWIPVLFATVVGVWSWACGEDDGDIAGPGEAPNRAPVAVGEIPSQTIFLGETATVDVSAAFTDPDGDALTFGAVSSDTAVVVVTTSGSEVTLEGSGRGVATVTVTARDAEGGAASQSFGVEVPNRTPLVVGEIPPQTMFLGETATVDVAATFADPDGDALTFGAVSSDTAVVVVTTSGSEVTLEGSGRGVATVTVTARDAEGGAASQSFGVPEPDTGVGEIPPTVPNRRHRGVVTARDAEGGAASQSFGVEVPNRTPLVVGEIPPQTMFLGETATVDVAATFADPDGDALTFGAVSSDTAVASSLRPTGTFAAMASHVGGFGFGPGRGDRDGAGGG